MTGAIHTKPTLQELSDVYLQCYEQIPKQLRPFSAFVEFMQGVGVVCGVVEILNQITACVYITDYDSYLKTASVHYFATNQHGISTIRIIKAFLSSLLTSPDYRLLRAEFITKNSKITRGAWLCGFEVIAHVDGCTFMIRRI